MWSHILRDQLDVTEDEFWSACRKGFCQNEAPRTFPRRHCRLSSCTCSINKVGLAEADVAAMTKDEAVARLNQYWTTGS